MMASLVAALRDRVARHPVRDALVFVESSTRPAPISYSRLDRDARRGAVELLDAGVRPGDPVILNFGHGYQLVAAFWSALYAGAVPAIFPYPEAIPHVDLRRERLRSLVAFSGAPAVICSTASVEEMKSLLAGGPTTAVALSGSGPDPEAWTPPRGSGEDLAYIQFSSGTTGRPKGVMLSHRAALNNVRAQSTHWSVTEEDVSVNWLPLYHDMGLFIEVLLPLLTGARSVSIAPTHWVRRPQVLFHAIHEHRGTLTLMPNLSYGYCLHTVRDDDLEGVDLSSWRILGNGSEPVQAEMLHRFGERFGRFGLATTSLIAGYGMAENALVVASTLPGHPPQIDHVAITALQAEGRSLPVPADEPGARGIVSCGPPVPGVVVGVVDQADRPLPERHVGEIVVRGDSLFSGYFNDPENTVQAVRDGWFYTGDLGYLADGELFICDRKQDLIIVGGRNIFAESIEAIAREALKDQVRHLAAFGVLDEALSTETPVLVCEGRPGLDSAQEQALAEVARVRVSQFLGVTLGDVHFVPRGWIVRTTSGKLARSACRDKYVREDRRPAAPAARLSPALRDDRAQLQAALSAHVGQMLGVTDVQPGDNFFDLGGDSLTALRLVLSVEEQLETTIGPSFFQDPTVAHLAELVGDAQVPARGAPATSRRRPPSDQMSAVPSLRKMVRRGPIVRGRPMLSYGLGVRLQRAWLKLPSVQRRLFSEEITVLRRWGDRIGARPDADHILEHLLANSWAPWRDRAMTSPTASDWVEVRGEWPLPSGEDRPGLILLILHSPLTSIALSALASMSSEERPHLSIRDRANGAMVHAADLAFQVYRAHELLREGGVVIIAGDGIRGPRGITTPFFGGRFRFRQGGAELAVRTGATLIPVFNTINSRGRIEIEVCPPLEGGSGDPQTRIDRMVQAYADLMIARWPEVYSSMSSGYLAGILKVMHKQRQNQGNYRP